MDNIKIGKFISLCRKEKELTQKDLAEILGVSDKTVSKWERGINLPDASLYYLLCDTLGISINELFIGERLCEQEMIKKSEESIINSIEDGKRIINISRLIKLLVLFLVPLIIIQWKYYYLGNSLLGSLGFFFENGEVINYSNLYLLSSLYFVIYYMIYKKIKIGYYLMWILFIVLMSIYLIIWSIDFSLILLLFSFNLWVNILLTIIGILSKEIQPSLLFKRT